MREIVKLGVVAAVILIAAVLIALFASGYISAFKPGGARDSAAGEHVVGSSGGGLGRGVSVVSTPSPSPAPPAMPQMPESMPAQAGQPPFPESQSAMPALPPAPSPPPLAGWTDGGMIQDRQAMPAMAGPSASPMPLPYEPGGTSFSWSPNEMGWMQIILRVIGILPLLFPGLTPVYTWWPGGT